MKLCIFAACIVAALSAEARLRLRDSEGNQAVIRFSGAEGLKIPQHTDVLANVVARVENLEESLTKTDVAWLDATESLKVLLDELTKRVKANEEAHVKDSDALETAKTKYDQAEEQLKSKIKEANDKRKSEDDELRMKLGGLEALSYEEDARIEKRLDTEIDNRSKGDENNSQEVTQEKEAREGKDKELERSIAEESETREKGDKNLQESIDTVDREREEGDRENAESINKERTERANADAATNGRVDDEAVERRRHDQDLHSKIDGEIVDRSEGDEGVEARLTTKLDNAQKDHIEEHMDLHDRVDNVDINLENAKKDRVEEDENLHDRIDNANKARADGDDSLDAKLTTHKEDTQDKIDREAEARRADINNEAATRESEIQNARDAASAHSDQVEAISKYRDNALLNEIQNAKDAASARSDQVEADSKDRDTALQNAVDGAKGERGEKGAKGERGEKGEKGEQGETPTTPAPAARNCRERLSRDTGYFTLANGKQVYCRGDETLIYHRGNYAFGPDHMTQDVSEPARLDTNSKSWYIPEGVTKWRWEVSNDSGNSWQFIETNIPSQAYSTNRFSTSTNVVLSGVNTGGGMQTGGGTLYYQKGFSVYGCSSGSGTWYGLARSKQGHGDQSPNGIGGHCDSCSFGSGLNANCSPGGDCFTSQTNVEQYISNWKNVGGSNGIGGTTCTHMSSPKTIQYRFWAK